MGPSGSAVVPAPSAGPYSYTEHQGLNCYHGHGAVDIDAVPVPNLTAAQCVARCSADEHCSCAQYSEHGVPGHVPAGSCWKRSMCVVEQCKPQAAAEQSVYVKDYFVHNSTNCFEQHGATCLPEPCSTHSVAKSPEQCAEQCEADSGCTAAVFRADNGWCWKRANVDVASCRSEKGDTLLVKPSTGIGPGPQGPMLYAATLSEGPMPAMYGY